MRFSKPAQKICLSTLFAIGIAACATLVDGSQQTVKFEVRGAEKARCNVYNDDYKYLVYAPAEVVLERSYKALRAECSGTGGRNIAFKIPSIEGGSGATALNAANGILPGVMTDITTGAFFAFPDTIIVDFDLEPGYIAGKIVEDQVQPSGQNIGVVWPENMVDDQDTEGYNFMPIDMNADAAERNYTPSMQNTQEMSVTEGLHKLHNTQRVKPIMAPATLKYQNEDQSFLMPSSEDQIILAMQEQDETQKTNNDSGTKAQKRLIEMPVKPSMPKRPSVTLSGSSVSEISAPQPSQEESSKTQFSFEELMKNMFEDMDQEATDEESSLSIDMGMDIISLQSIEPAAGMVQELDQGTIQDHDLSLSAHSIKSNEANHMFERIRADK